MTLAEQYQKLSADFRAKAQCEESVQLRAEWEIVSDRYALLAEQAVRENGVSEAIAAP